MSFREPRNETETTLTQAVVFLLVSQIVSVGGIVLLGLTTDLVLALPFLMGVVCWIASGFVRQGQTYEDSVMVKYGHPIRSNVTATYYVSVAVVSSSFFSLATLLLLHLSMTEPSSSTLLTTELLGTFEVLLVGVAFRSGCNAYREITNSRTEYRSPIQYDPSAFAAQGEVYLGSEFRHQTLLPVQASSDTGAAETLPGLVVARQIMCEVGEDRPFLIDLAKARNPHVLITSISGGGKTQTVRALILRSYQARHIPSLVLDWTGEQSDFIQNIGGIVWRVPVNFKLNPVRLLDFSPAERAAELEESLTFTLGLSSLQAAEVGKVALEACRQAGILDEDPSTWSHKPPEWRDLIAILEARAQHGYYKGQQLESVNWTIRKLYRAIRIFGDEPTNFFDVILKVPVCIDMSALKGADAAKALVTYTILQRIYHAFDTRGFSDLRLLIILDEAHLMLSQKREEKATLTQEPLPVRLVRLGRKYGFALIFASQVPTIDLPEPIIANVATVIALPHEAPVELNFIKRWVNLSKTELEIYSRLPPGGCFIKQIGNRYSSLVKIQMVSDREIKMARIRNIIQPVTTQPQFTKLKEPSQLTETPAADQLETIEDKLLRLLDSGKPKLPEQTPQNASANVHEVQAGAELTLQENRVFNILLGSPTTMKKLQAELPELTYRQMLQILQHLEELRLIQVARVPNLQGQWVVYYGALKAAWLQSESLTHRALIELIVQELLQLSPIPYMQTQRLGGDTPDVGLEAAKPRAAIEVETGRKKMPPAEVMRWAMRVRERNLRLGYERTIVVVPNLTVKNHYAEPCSKQGLELVTIGRLLSQLQRERIESG